MRNRLCRLAARSAARAWLGAGMASALAAAAQPAASPAVGSTVRVSAAAVGLTAHVLTPADSTAEAKVDTWMRQAAAGWIPNLGQNANGTGSGAPPVLYSLRAGNAHVQVTERGLETFFYSGGEEEGEGGNAPHRGPVAREVEWRRVDLVLEGAKISPARATAAEPLTDQGSRSYFLSHCPQGVTNVPAYGRVTFRDVYPGIDWVLTSAADQPVHHEFVVHPGADPQRIRLSYRGADAIELSPDAQSLCVRTSLGEVREGPLDCFQAGPAGNVRARFRLRNGTVTVAVDRYDRAAPLVIDPPLLWSTYYGGNNFDGTKSLLCDNVNGDIYVVGYSSSPGAPVFNPQNGAYFQGTNVIDHLAFIWKFSQFGVRKWATYYGGAGLNFANDCALDPLGNLYVTGFTNSGSFPTQFLTGAYNQPAVAGATDAFVIKFNSQGVRQWATCYGGTNGDFGTGITTDPLGRVYLCGYSGSNDMPLANPGNNAYFQPSPGLTDGFLARFGTLGALEWGTYFGADSLDAAEGIVATPSAVYVTGTTKSPNFPLANPGGAYMQTSIGGEQDLYVARFSLAGALTWSTYYGGSAEEFGNQVAVDGAGNLYVAGLTMSADMQTQPLGGTAYMDATLGGLRDICLLKFSPSNARLWATYFGGSNEDSFIAAETKPITLDAQDRLYLTGRTASTDLDVIDPGGNAYYEPAAQGAFDAFFARFAADATLQWCTYFGTTQTDFGTSLGVGEGGCLFATGESWSGGSMTTANPGFSVFMQNANAGSDDSFFTKFCAPASACCVELSCAPVTSAAQCATLGGVYYANQTCANTMCTISCDICGRKFSDANRDGVQNNGEAGLPGWTIELRSPNGVVVATAVTDAQGDYCFNGVACSPWLVTEAQQPGVVKIYPAGAGHTVSPPPNTTQTNVDFGNYTCPPPPPCSGVPAGLVAWWPFDDGPGATTAKDVTHAAPPRNVAQLVGGAVGGQGALCVTGPGDYARVPFAGQLGLDFGAGSFSVATWLKANPSSAGPRGVVERRDAAGALGVKGWALYLNGQQIFLDLPAGGAPQVVPGPFITAGSWTHLAVAVDRTHGVGHWFVNGQPVPTFDFLPVPGSVSSDADVWIGQTAPAFGAGPGLQGCIAGLALFPQALDAAVVSKMVGPGPGTGPPPVWCPEYALMPTVTNVCATQTSVSMCFNIVNMSAVNAVYSWSLAGLPVGPGCTFPGPSQFSPASGSVTVPAGGISPSICVTIPRPPGFTAQGATACYALTFANQATGVCRTRQSMLRVNNACWCADPVSAAILTVPGGSAGGRLASFAAHRPCDPAASMPYRVLALPQGQDYPDPLTISLDGLPPGVPSTGVLTAGPDTSPSIDVLVSYPGGYDAGAAYEIALEADVDGDGAWDRLASRLVVPAYDAATDIGAPGPAATRGGLRLLAGPNPFASGTTVTLMLAAPRRATVDVYDAAGRVVRSLSRSALAAGTHQIHWDGRDAAGRAVPAGVYLVRMRTQDAAAAAKIVKMR